MLMPGQEELDQEWEAELEVRFTIIQVVKGAPKSCFVRLHLSNSVKDLDIWFHQNKEFGVYVKFQLRSRVVPFLLGFTY